MTTFADFVSWAGSQSRAAQMVDLSESMLSLILSGKRPLLPSHVIRAERASNALFRCDQMLPDTEFIRDAHGIHWVAREQVPHEKQTAAAA